MKWFGLLGAGFALGMAAPAAALTFATFSQVGTAPNLSWVQQGSTGGQLFTTSSGTGTSFGSADVRFNFLQPALADFGTLDARYSLMAVALPGSAAASVGTLYSQPLTLGSLSFTYTGDRELEVNGNRFGSGANLLTVTFGGGSISGSGSSGGVQASTEAGHTVLFSSDFLTFDDDVARDFALNMTSIAPTLFAQSAQSLRNFRASSGGAFSLETMPGLAPPPAAAPEPGTWIMLIAGFGLVGGQLRRRRQMLARVTG